MKNTLYNHTTLITLLIITNLSLLHASSQYQGPASHTPLVHLYYKGTRKESRKDVPTTIGLFKIACKNIQTIDGINKERMKNQNLPKKPLSGYDLDVLKVYYLLTKKNNDENDIEIGNKALVQLYYESTQEDKQDTPTTIKLFETACKNIRAVDEIDKQSIKPKMLGKSKSEFSNEDHDLDVLKVYYLLNKKNNENQKLSTQKILAPTENTKILSNTNTSSLYNKESITSQETVRIHEGTSQFQRQTVSFDLWQKTRQSTSVSPKHSLETPEESSDESTRKSSVEAHKLRDQLKKQTQHRYPETFEPMPPQPRNQYQTFIELNPEQEKNQLKLDNRYSQESLIHHPELANTMSKELLDNHMQRIQKELKHAEELEKLEQEIKRLQSELDQAKTPVKQEDKSHAVQYGIATIIGCIIGIGIDQVIHKVKAKIEEKEKELEELS